MRRTAANSYDQNQEYQGLVERAMEDPDHIAVLADWLVERGDPNGEVLARLLAAGWLQVATGYVDMMRHGQMENSYLIEALTGALRDEIQDIPAPQIEADETSWREYQAYTEQLTAMIDTSVGGVLQPTGIKRGDLPGSYDFWPAHGVAAVTVFFKVGNLDPTLRLTADWNIGQEVPGITVMVA